VPSKSRQTMGGGGAAAEPIFYGTISATESRTRVGPYE
jgi:hypothetical protein